MPASRRWVPGWPTSSAGSDEGGLIHADLHLGNALFQRGQVKLIDFDDCGTGPRLYDSPSPSGSCGTNRTTRRTGTRCWPATDINGDGRRSWRNVGPTG